MATDQKRRIAELKLKAALCRKNVLRMIRAGGHGHVGGAFSAMDIVTALYFDKMNVDPQDPKNPEVLDTYGALGSHIPGHPDMYKLSGVEANTGALGHGMSIANGMAAAAKLDGKDYKVYAVTGDGELPEGSNWEAAAAAAKFKLDNLTVFVDNNGLQISGKVTDVMSMEPIDKKFEMFGWAVRTIDGNSMEEIVETLDALPFEEGKPSCVVMKTVKAKGLPFGENNAAFHFWNATPEGLEEANAALDEQIGMLEKELEELK